MKIQQSPTDIIFYVVGLFFIPAGRIGRLDFTLGVTALIMLTNFVLWRPLKNIPLGTLQQKLQLENA